MTSTLRFFQLLAITTWVGGLIFFAFVLAPTAFHTLPTITLAGSVVGACLRVFDIVALACGALFLPVTALLYRQAPNRIRGRYEIEFLLAGVMLLATAYIHWNLLPRMDQDRARAGGDIALAAEDHPARLHFNKLHTLSERVEGTALFLGLGVIFLLSREHARVD